MKDVFVGHVLRYMKISVAICLWVVYTETEAEVDQKGIRSIVAIYRLAQDRDKWRATAVNCVPSV